MGRLPGIDVSMRIAAGAFSNWRGAPARPAQRHHQRPELRLVVGSPDLRVGIISNAKAHRNLSRAATAPAGLSASAWTTPSTHLELSDALAGFAARDVNVLVVDGGDGTVREVLTHAQSYFPKTFPTLVLLPSGKTNALALDLGIPPDWTLAVALDAIRAGQIKHRSPMEIWRPGASAPELRGFLFGAGAFVRATKLAQRVHSAGAFDGLAVGLSLASAIAQTYFGGKANTWRQGERMRIGTSDNFRAERLLYIALGSTLNRLPLGIKPFGKQREGLKLLGIEAPPRHMLMSVPALLAGSEAAWLERAGYHRAIADTLHLSLQGGFILDGEFYRGGDLILKKGAAVNFAVA